MSQPSPLLVGVPTETKTDEFRVAITPDGVREMEAIPMPRRGLKARLAICALLLAAGSGCSVHVGGTRTVPVVVKNPPPRVVVTKPPAPVVVVKAKRSYRYYPEARVYYAIDRDVWYWRDGARWRWGSRLPMNMQARLEVPVTIVLKLLPRRGPRVTGPVDGHPVVTAACRFHRSPFAVYTGYNRHVRLRGTAPPRRLLPAPLNLIYRSESPRAPKETFAFDIFEFLDMDGY